MCSRRLLRRAVRHAWQLRGKDLITPHAGRGDHRQLWATGYPRTGRQRQDLSIGRGQGGGAFPSDPRIGPSVARRRASRGRELRRSPGRWPSSSTTHSASRSSSPPRSPTSGESRSTGRLRRGDGEPAKAEPAKRGRAGTRRRGRAALPARCIDETGPTVFIGYETEAGDRPDPGDDARRRDDREGGAGQEVEIFLDVAPLSMPNPGARSVTPVRSTPRPGLAVYRHPARPAGSPRSSGPRLHPATCRWARPPTLVIDSPPAGGDPEDLTPEPTSSIGRFVRCSADHAHQAGSLVESGRLRFDFSHFAAVAPPRSPRSRHWPTPPDRERAGDDDHHDQGGGRARGGPGLLRRQVRRHGAACQDRSVLRRALRRHPHPYRGPGGAADRASGVVDRLQYPPDRGPDRRWRPISSSSRSVPGSTE